MKKEYILECCVDTIEAAQNAIAGGAGRIELCGNLIIGGTTPSPVLCEIILNRSDIPVRAMIRPRFGDFLYTDGEFEIMRRETALFRDMGCEGVVFGILTADGKLDKKRMAILREEARGMKVTLHRAFDLAIDPFDALETAREIGIDTILTAGQRQTALEGKESLRDLAKASWDIEIMAGSSVDAHAIRELKSFTGISSYHLSGRVQTDSPMIYRKHGINMGLASISEYQRWECSIEKVAAARAAMEG